MTDNKALLVLGISLAITVAGQVNSIREMFGVEGNFSVGLFYLSLLLLFPIAYLAYRRIKFAAQNKARHSIYEDFLEKNFLGAKVVVAISSGAEQLCNYLEGFALEKHKSRPEVNIYLRQRDDGAVFEHRAKRLKAALERHKISYKIYAFDWNPMMLSAVVFDDKEAIFNVYLEGADGYMSRIHQKYLHATRGRCEFDQWLFAFYDKWVEDCKNSYKSVP